MEITKVNEYLNNAFKASLVRFEVGEIRSTINIKLVENDFIQTDRITPTKAFYENLDKILKSIGHSDYEFNNTKQIIIL